MHVVGGRAVAYAGAPSGKIIRYEFCASDDCPDHPGTMATLTRTTTTLQKQGFITSASSRKLRRCSLGAIVGLAAVLLINFPLALWMSLPQLRPVLAANVAATVGLAA